MYQVIANSTLMSTIKKVKSLATRAALPVMTALPAVTSAATPQTDGRQIGVIPNETGVFQSTSLIDTIELVIRWILGFVGIIIFIIFLLAGFEYATAGGDEGKAKTAQTRMVNAVIGLIIIFFAFVATNAVVSFVLGGSAGTV